MSQLTACEEAPATSTHFVERSNISHQFCQGSISAAEKHSVTLTHIDRQVTTVGQDKIFYDRDLRLT